MSDIRAAQAMGFDTIRKHGKLEPARWYYHCDRLGMLVWQDLPSPPALTCTSAADGKEEWRAQPKEPGDDEDDEQARLLGHACSVGGVCGVCGVCACVACVACATRTAVSAVETVCALTSRRSRRN